MNIKLSNWFIFGTLLIFGLIMFGLIKGCEQYNKTQDQLVDYKGRVEKLAQDSIEYSKQAIEYKNQNELIDGQLEVANNRNSLYLDSFRLLNDHINDLKKRYREVTPNEDTTVTLVPNSYISDCADCFTSIEKAQHLGLRYKAELDNADYLNKSKVNVLSNRISLLEKQNVQLGKNYRSLLDSASKQKPELRRTLFLSMGAMSINQAFPNAIGAGFMYEDKKRRIYGAKYYISEYGSIYQADLSLPLSLKFK